MNETGMKYYISSMSDRNYSNSNEIIWFVYLHCNSQPTVKLELEITGVKTENDINNIVWEFNNPLRLKNTYYCHKIEEENNIFITTISKYNFKCIVRCANKKDLCDFIHFINNPENIGVDVLIQEHIRLSRIIDANYRSLMKLIKERRFLEYRIWGYNNDMEDGSK